LEEAKKKYQEHLAKSRKETQERMEQFNQEYTKKLEKRNELFESITLQDEIRTIIQSVLKGELTSP